MSASERRVAGGGRIDRGGACACPRRRRRASVERETAGTASARAGRTVTTYLLKMAAHRDLGSESQRV